MSRFHVDPLAKRLGSAATAAAGLALGALALAVVLPPVFLGWSSALLSTGVALAVPGLIATVAGRAPDSMRRAG
ncbi:hypothetical protein FF100_15940 [Methylobacterium terricola]|uniref:Uncharacterized protein n=1 Tax=Methylobacterium terricola TaxID=2583531 RepID=A0A5C4LH53_9HYPH|nr:hypothetical protein [Methylobacterium terricola]TNC12322.1 hypothetical protein FF100_15940 [Methylobacterium terricola]